MKKIETLFVGIGLLAVITVTGATLWQVAPSYFSSRVVTQPMTKYGAFLAAHHAIYVNDFDSAAEFSKSLQDKELPIIKNTIILSDFLSGKLPADSSVFTKNDDTPAMLIHDAYSLQNDDWDAVYAKHKKDESTLAAPLRIWSGVATGKVTETLKFIDSLHTNDSWKSFVRGQIYAETKQTEKAAQQFAKVSPDFMNINDYMYIMAFYEEFDMRDATVQLRTEFTERPGGMFMLDSKITPKWSDYAGFKRELTFSLVQNVSHTQVMMYSDLSLILLRFAEIAQGDITEQNDAINYYLGLYFFNNGGDYKKFFAKIDEASPYYPFAMMKIAEKTGKITELERATRANPLFVPAINKLVAKKVAMGEKNGAIRVINRALKNDNLTDAGRAFFLKTRGQIYLTFGDLENAQEDIHSAAKILPMDIGILALQSRTWAAQNRELDTAYEYAIALVHKSPADVEAWDILGVTVWAREGATEALDILERVGQVSGTCSSLFEHLGDLYAETGDKKRATDSYLRAIELSDDGLTIVPVLEKKIRDLK